MSSSRRPGTGSPTPRSSETKRSKEPPEILHQLGRFVLAYSLKKLSEQKTQSQQRSRSSRRGSSPRPPSKNRDHSTIRRRDSSRDLPRSDSGDIHTLASQLAVGVLAFGIRHLALRRREAKSKVADAASQSTGTTSRTMNSNSTQDQGVNANIDPELSAALDAVTMELQGATESIRRLAYAAPPPLHRNCAVRDALVADAERLSGSLSNMQASINNMRNLHPGLEERVEKRPRERPGAKDGERQTKSTRLGNRRDGMTEGVREKGRAEEWAERVRHSKGKRAEDLAGSETDRRQRQCGGDDGGPHDRSVERLRRCVSRRDDELQRGRRLTPVER
ncbi:hypothetical protein N657DRAFT_162771 [Parathielavia appendiculata]|uniref:Uncharacterized protein n=1 Tax=Parathielavia appendiculata TaxID=2587402 RepID=A0AAN6TT27_9PEZI|nr:hypothetical protein N657DRAFT_162771 [Parathielavia appendiculata]